MVEGVRDVVKTLAQCTAGASRDAITKELLAKFTALCEDTLIELQYSLLLITKEVHVPLFSFTLQAFDLQMAMAPSI